MNPCNTALLSDAANYLIRICGVAANKGLMAGWSGNASLRLESGILITASGSAKGFLQPQDCLFLDREGRPDCAQGAKPSSETAMHLALYESLPDCMAILHTHPAMLQSLSLALSASSRGDSEEFAARFLNLPLYESNMWRPHLGIATAFPPGSAQLGAAAAKAAQGLQLPSAVWLTGHGLCALAASLTDALCITEELEHLASVQLAVLKIL